MISRREELTDFPELYDYMELNLSEIELKLSKDDCDYNKTKIELNSLIKFMSVY